VQSAARRRGGSEAVVAENRKRFIFGHSP
jgi:hypothetical protein